MASSINTESKIKSFCDNRQRFRKLEAQYNSLRCHECDTGNLFHLLEQQRRYMRYLIDQMVSAMDDELPNFYNKAALIEDLSRPFLKPKLRSEELIDD